MKDHQDANTTMIEAVTDDIEIHLDRFMPGCLFPGPWKWNRQSDVYEYWQNGNVVCHMIGPLVREYGLAHYVGVLDLVLFDEL